MRQLQFEGEITEAARYALRYASDFYDVKEAKDFDSLFQINSRDFLNKCYEGYKISQDIIVRNILSIENELKVKQKELTNFKKGKHHKELYRDPVYKRLVENETQLRIQRAAFHEVANSIVWTVLLQERTHVKSFIQPGGGSGYLRDRNIDSVIAVAKNHNENPNKFTLICDITSCLHVGDLLTVGNGKLTITEVKDKGQVNDLVSEIIHGSLKKMSVNIDAIKKLKLVSPKHGFKQVERNFNQLRNFFSTKEYIQTDETFDSYFQEYRKAITIFTEDKNYSDLVETGLDELYKSDKSYLILPSDCCIIGLFKRKEDESGFVRRMDFRHHLYHWTKEPYEKCQYLDPHKAKFSKEDPPEFVKYHELPIHSFKEKIFVPTHPPIFFVLKEKYAVDLLIDKIDIYIYFDYQRFFEMCKERGLNPRWLSVSDLAKGENKNSTSYLPDFDGKYLEIADTSNKSKSTFGYGLLYRILFEFQWGYNVIDQFKEQLWIDSHPIWNEIRTRVRLKIRYLRLKWYIYKKYVLSYIRS